MTNSKLPLIAAAGAAALWTAKAVAIGLAGGLDKSPMEGPLFLAGLLASIVAVVALALSLTAERRAAARIAAAVGGVVATFVVAGASTALVEAVVTSEHWVWAEVNLWVLAAGLLALALSRRPTRPSLAA